MYPRCCGDYAENDIYYLEVCVLSEICANSDEMWRAAMGDTFRCQVSIQNRDLAEAKGRSRKEAEQNAAAAALQALEGNDAPQPSQ